MKIKAVVAGAVLPVLFVLGILTAMVTGYWKTEGSKVPAKYNTGIFEGEYNPGDIRGSYSLKDISEVFDIPVSVLAKAYGLADSEDAGVVQVKTFEESFGHIDGLEVGTDSMRLFVALYKGLPYQAGEDTALPEPAWNILNQQGAADSEILEMYRTKVLSLGDLRIEGQSEEHIAAVEERLVKGKTVFSELLDWGVTEEEITGILGGPMGATGMSVRDFCIEQGIEFSGVKSALQELVNQKE